MSSASAEVPIVVIIAFLGLFYAFLGYIVLKSWFPGRGFGVLRNIFKKTIRFQQAIQALQEGKRIRRKRERQGYTKLFILEGKKERETYARYYAHSKEEAKDISYGPFSIEDVLAKDWVIDE